VSAAAAAFILGASSSAQGQVAGLVNEFGGSPLQDATIEVWDSYPSGLILTSGTSGVHGTFALPDPGAGTFDLRVRRNGYIPTVIRDLPDPISNVIATLTASSATQSNPLSMDCSGSTSTFLGEPIQPGDVVEAIDGDNVYCGMDRVTTDGHYQLHILGDSPEDGDQGATVGEAVTPLINRLAATPTVTFFPFSFLTQELTGPATAPGVTVVGPADLGGHAGDEILASYTVTNTGTIAGSFDLDVSIEPAWTITIIGGLTVGPLDPGESKKIDILVEAPEKVAAITAALVLSATSAEYAPANCGSSTTIDVQATGVGDDGGSGSLLPSQFSLAQNYPNPFNPETQIAFNIAEAGRARLEIFNILGQSVDVLLDEYVPVGQVIRQWDGRDRNGAEVPSGIYFYRLRHNGASVTRQMVLLR
jgi:hypothetical protein